MKLRTKINGYGFNPATITLLVTVILGVIGVGTYIESSQAKAITIHDATYNAHEVSYLRAHVDSLESRDRQISETLRAIVDGQNSNFEVILEELRRINSR